jgi:hypothetical protein
MRRLEVLVPPDDTVAYLDAMEKFSEKAEEGESSYYIIFWIWLDTPNSDEMRAATLTCVISFLFYHQEMAWPTLVAGVKQTLEAGKTEWNSFLIGQKPTL